MRANTWMGKTHVEVQDVPDPKILNARDAIVKITSTAICGSDLHLYGGFIPTMRKGDILVIFDYRRYQADTIESAQVTSQSSLPANAGITLRTREMRRSAFVKVPFFSRNEDPGRKT